MYIYFLNFSLATETLGKVDTLRITDSEAHRTEPIYTEFCPEKNMNTNKKEQVLSISPSYRFQFTLKLKLQNENL